MSLPNTHWGAEAIAKMLADCRRVFFIGIGGVSMCSLAQITLSNGMEVGGSDRTDSERLDRLRSMGADIYIGHSAGHVKNADAVVYTVAIGRENPEYAAAELAGKPLISRADYLGYLMMRYSARIGIAGMNGKSTTTAMCAHLLMQEGDPTVFGGADAVELGGNSCRIGKAKDQFVFEACEYKDSFLDLNPTLAVILNIGMDHVDYFHSMEQIRTSFLNFARRTGPNGTVLFNADDAESVRAMEELTAKKLTFGVLEKADFQATDIRSEHGRRSFDFCFHGKKLCRVSLRQPGDYQVYNALAAASAATLCGISPETIADGIATFVGVKRRMEYRGRLNGAAVYDDYAHHPSAIEATLAGAREMGFERILCAYQPHTYSRTAGLFGEFSRAFDLADKVFFADIYAAREVNESGVSSAQLAEAVGERAICCGDLQTLSRTLQSEARPGDLLLIMGAGDIEDIFQILPLTE